MNPTSSLAARLSSGFDSSPASSASASWATRVLDGLRRFGERRALKQMLALRSDRLLADIGYSRQELAAEIDAAVQSLQERRDAERRIERELAGHSDAELDSMGIARLDIRRVSRERARQAVAVGRPKPPMARSA
ncbi:hypothetical protein [Pelagibius sp. 7325]|uniref:hypothetical protein n=1 Tax=Pelagibius sp. 7325 TaxID=3131994 RepID=UPI0030EF372D